MKPLEVHEALAVRAQDLEGAVALRIPQQEVPRPDARAARDGDGPLGGREGVFDPLPAAGPRLDLGVADLPGDEPEGDEGDGDEDRLQDAHDARDARYARSPRIATIARSIVG